MTVPGTDGKPKDHYLPGAYNSPESVREYDRISGEAVLTHVRRNPADPTPVTVSELIAAFWKHESETSAKPYRHPTSTGAYTGTAQVEFAILRRLYGHTAAARFGPLALRTVREAMKTQKVLSPGRGHLTWSRQHINASVRRIRQMFRWGASYELVPATVAQVLGTVEAVKPTAGIRETAAVKPAPLGLVQAVIDIATPTVAAMLRLQLLTGMRQGEIVIMRACDIKMGEGVWWYSPEHHKTSHLGRTRTIPLGSKAKSIVQEFLTTKPADYLFKPANSRREQAERQAASSSKSEPDRQKKRANCEAYRRRNGRKVMSNLPRYSSQTYTSLVSHLCSRAFPPPPQIAADAEQSRKWKHEHSFHAHQLRHNYASTVAARYGMDATQKLLSHSDRAITAIYVEPDVTEIERIAAAIG